MKLALGSDHAGFALKQKIKSMLETLDQDVLDIGTYSTESVDYPDYAARVARLIQTGQADRGILICGTGIGVAIAANKFPGIRAALCLTPYMVEMARRHNDANILTLGARLEPEIDDQTLRTMLRRWLETPFEGGRHQKRLNKIRRFETSLPAAAPDPVSETR